MAVAMATMNVVTASTAVAVASTPVLPRPSSAVAMGSFRGQRLVVGRGAGVAVRWAVQVRAEKRPGEQLQNAGEQFSAAVQRGAESVRDNLQGTQADATSKAKSAASTGQSKAKQGANEAESVGSKIAGQAEDLKDKLFGAGKDVQKDAEKNVSKAKSAASSTGKDAQNNAGNVLENVQQGLSDAADNVKDALNGNKN